MTGGARSLALASLGFAVACGSLNTGEVIISDDPDGGDTADEGSGGSAGDDGNTDTTDADGATTSAGGADINDSTSGSTTDGGSAGENDDSSHGGGDSTNGDTTSSTTGSSCTEPCSGGQTCQEGTCECPEDEPERCSERCTDLLTDSDNCGRCGHSCHDGGCSDGRCEAITLVTGRSAPWELAVNESGVYWLEEDAVLATPLDGDAVVVLAEEDEVAKPASIAASPSNVYYTNTGTDALCTCHQRKVMEVPVVGGGEPHAFAATGTPWGVTYADGVVYWCDRGAEIIYRANEGMGDAPDEIFSGGLSAYPPPYDLVVDESFVYWGDYSNRVLKHAFSDGYVVELHVLEPPSRVVNQLALGGGYVYWSTGTPTTPQATTPTNSIISKVPIEGGDLVPVVSGLTVTPALAADESGVYWSDGNIKRTRHDGSPTETLVEGENAGFIALDDEFVYWTDATSGKVMKVAK